MNHANRAKEDSQDGRESSTRRNTTHPTESLSFATEMYVAFSEETTFALATPTANSTAVNSDAPRFLNILQCAKARGLEGGRPGCDEVRFTKASRGSSCAPSKRLYGRGERREGRVRCLGWRRRPAGGWRWGRSVGPGNVSGVMGLKFASSSRNAAADGIRTVAAV